MIGWNTLFLVFIANSCFPSGVQSILPADFESGWMQMNSQSSSRNYYLIVPHGLGEVPLKVKVLVKPRSGAYARYMFEAGSTQLADDDVMWLYCGILYIYQETEVRLYAPRRDNGMTTGRAFCIDATSWSSGYNSTTSTQVEQDVLIKVLAWKNSSFPTPELDTNWIAINTTGGSHFTQIQHSLGDELILAQLQIKCITIENNEMVYGEGTGAGSTPPSIDDTVVQSGILFAYSNTAVRVWVANDLRGMAYLFAFRDGFATTSRAFRCIEGYFRVTGWTSLGSVPVGFNFLMDNLNVDEIPDMSALKVNIREWDPLSNFISVQVKAEDGPNAGFLFPAIGQTQRNGHPGATYGGVAFAYSDDSIRMFVPINESGTMIHVPEGWGTAAYNQMSNKVRIVVKIWSTTISIHCVNKLTVGRFSRQGNTTCVNVNRTKCTSWCQSDPRCVGIIPCPPSQSCSLMNVNDLNNRIVSGLFGTQGEILLRTLVCQ